MKPVKNTFDVCVFLFFFFLISCYPFYVRCIFSLLLGFSILDRHNVLYVGIIILLDIFFFCLSFSLRRFFVVIVCWTQNLSLSIVFIVARLSVSSSNMCAHIICIPSVIYNTLYVYVLPKCKIYAFFMISAEPLKLNKNHESMEMANGLTFFFLHSLSRSL